MAELEPSQTLFEKREPGAFSSFHRSHYSSTPTGQRLSPQSIRPAYRERLPASTRQTKRRRDHAKLKSCAALSSLGSSSAAYHLPIAAPDAPF